MKKVKAGYSAAHELFDGILIQNMSDVMDFRDYAEGKIKEHLTWIWGRGIEPERYDHYYPIGPCRAIWGAMVVDIKVKGGVPWLKLDEHFKRYLVMLVEHLDATEVLENEIPGMIINQNGGLCPANNYPYQVDAEEFDWEAELFNIVLEPGSKYICLENDPTLEAEAFTWLNEHNEEKPSYITGLRYVSGEKLTSVLQMFKESGGECVYVRTTGGDVAQAMDYARSVISVEGLAIFIHFTAAPATDFAKVIELLESEGRLIGRA